MRSERIGARGGALLGLALAAVLVAGCSHLPFAMEPLEVFLVGIEPIESDNLEQRFDVRLRLLNPNQLPIATNGVDFTLEVNGLRLTRGLSDEVLQIPALGDAVVTVTATTTLLDLLRQVVHYSANESASFAYEVHGRVHRSDSLFSVPFYGAGQHQGPTATETETQ